MLFTTDPASPVAADAALVKHRVRVAAGLFETFVPFVALDFLRVLCVLCVLCVSVAAVLR